MNAAHVHLMLNHVSIIGSLFGLVLLAVAMIRRSRELVTVSLAGVVKLFAPSGGGP